MLEDSVDFGDGKAMEVVEGEKVKVIVRIRPLTSSETGLNHSIQLLSSQQLSITTSDQRKILTCSYDAILGPTVSQSKVYESVQECTAAVLSGINCTVFAYGQTGSGKTHSMYGPPNYIANHARETESLGVIPRAIHQIFELSRSADILDFQVHVSFVQVYNENLYDMLRDSSMMSPLPIREDSGREIYVQGLSEYNVKSVADTLQLLQVAEDNRAVRETFMNQFSSRSHSIFQITVEHKKVDFLHSSEVCYKAKFNLVDLAGSEKWDTKKYLQMEHISEMTNINLSLHTLGKCIAALAKQSRQVAGDNKTIHVPFRESKLTRLLQDSLGGNAKTILIATVSPSPHNIDETISTLKFADRAKQVMVAAMVNEFRPVDHAMVKRLQEEISILKQLLQKVVVTVEHYPSSSSSSGGDGGVMMIQKLAMNIKQMIATEGGPQLAANTSSSSMGSVGIAAPPLSLSNSPSFTTHQQQHAASGQQEYITSLEHTLNKEQTHAAHLMKKNETLIKELEELKAVNLSLTLTRSSSQHHQQQQQQQQQQQVQHTQFTLPPAQIAQISSSIKDLLQQNNTLLTKSEHMSKIMKQFFRFQIEEEEMKSQMLSLFDEMKVVKGYVAAQKVNDDFAFLEFLSSQSSAPPQSINMHHQPLEHGIAEEKKASSSNMLFSPSSISKQNGLLHASASAPSVIANMTTTLTAMNNLSSINRHSSSSSHAAAAVSHSNSSSSSNMKPHNHLQPLLLSSAVAVPDLQYSSHDPFDPLASKAKPVIAFRVRGQQQQPLSGLNSSNQSLNLQQALQADEEAMAKELKKQKARLKKKEKLDAWIKAKEDKALLEQSLEEQEKKAMQDAERERELKRQEYVQKQKAKLSNYQEKVKGETEKIQELINLGIDPRSLKL